MTSGSTMDGTPDFTLQRNAFGRLVLIDAAGQPHEGVQPVRAFPLAAPDEGLSLVGADGKELAWIERPSALPAPLRVLIEEELASREFVPVIRRLKSVSTFSTPSHWEVETDRGTTRLLLKGEEDIRRIGGGALLITDSQGLQFRVLDLMAMDRQSKRLLERFL